MEKWILVFWSKHGEREAFAIQAAVMAIGFIIAGLTWEPLSSLIDAGLTILIGVAMLFFNKARSPEGNGGTHDETPE